MEPKTDREWTQNEPKMGPEMDPKWCPKLTRNGAQKWPKMARKRGPKWTRNGPKTGPKLGPKMGPKWATDGAQISPKWSPKWAQNGARNLPWKTPRGILAARKRPQIDVHGPDSERPFGAVRLSELRIAFVNGSVCSERTKTRYFITRRPFFASANAKNERIPGLRDLALFWPVSGSTWLVGGVGGGLGCVRHCKNLWRPGNGPRLTSMARTRDGHSALFVCQN